MGMCIQKNFMLALIAGFGLVPAGRAGAQNITTLYSFTAITSRTNSDGGHPYAEFILSDNALYGTATQGGSSGYGTVFRINSDGNNFTTLHSFTGGTPYGGLVFSSNTLYGARSGNGIVYSLNSDGTFFTNLYIFPATPQLPRASLVLSDDTLYGTTERGGGNGTVFKLTTDGRGFTNLHEFSAFSNSTNNDGASPEAGLVLLGSRLYGTALWGGRSGKGSVFAVNTDGTSFSNLHSFTATAGYLSTNSEGANPFAGLIASANTLFGTTLYGGNSDFGTVFKVNTDGTSFTSLHSFTGSDGAYPRGRLVLSGHTLYGTAASGGDSGNGTVFRVNTDGTGFTILHKFTATSGILSTNSDGANPYAGLILSGNALFGTTLNGGSSGSGTVFSLSLPSNPNLTIAMAMTNIILKWPTNTIGFVLQSTTNLEPPAVWSTNSPEPTISDGWNVVTNPIFGPEKFFRLSQ
jgi:uncharacterized repeat protein (TIGR03803 family)